MSTLPGDAPSPRLCIIVKWPDFEGYGFNLHAEKSKPGQYIGKVDDNSPAEAAGLLEDDRIIEVNGANIANENHKQVVQRIKAVPNETRLLVVDPKTDKYYKSKNIVVRGSQENVIVRSSARDQKRSATPEPRQPAAAVSNGHHDEADNRSVSSAASSSATSEVSTQPQHAATLDEPDKDKDATVEDASAHQAMEEEKSRSPSPPPAEETEKPSDEVAAPEEDGASQSGSDKFSEKDVIVAAEDSVTEATEIDSSHGEEPTVKNEEVLPEAVTLVEEGVEQEAKEKLEEKEERSAESISPPPAEQESDLEAEYDNVEIGAGRAAGAATQPASDSRRLSASSGDSHSSHGTDTARTTDPHTQSPMSTSPTPPPSLEPAPAPEPVRNSPSPKPLTTATTTTTATNNTNSANPMPRPVSNNKNAYNSSGLNLNMSAAEMRAKLASKKKADPRRDTVDLKKKYEIIQNM